MPGGHSSSQAEQAAFEDRSFDRSAVFPHPDKVGGGDQRSVRKSLDLVNDDVVPLLIATR